MSTTKSASKAPISTSFASRSANAAGTEVTSDTAPTETAASTWTTEKVVTAALSTVLIPAAAVGFGFAASASNFGPIGIGLVALVQGGVGYAISAGIGSLFRQE